MSRWIAALLTSALLGLGLTSSFVQANTAQHTKPFTVALVSSSVKQNIKRAQPFADYMASQLSDYGYTHGEVLVAASVDELARMIERQQVELSTATLYSAIELERAGHVELSGLRWKQNSPAYHSVIFSRSDSEVKNVDDLIGKVIAFEKPSSTSAFFLPANHLLSQGLKLEKVNSIHQMPSRGKVGYVFIKELLNNSNELNMSIWVFHRRVDAAAFSNLDWGDNETNPQNVAKALNIVSESESYPRSLMLTSSWLDGTLRLDIQRAMYAAENSDNGKAALINFRETTKIEPFSRDVALRIDSARTLFDDVIALTQQ